MAQEFIPHSYQKEAINHIVSNKHAGLFLGTGLGKTSILLSAIRALKHKREIDRVLIVAPLRVCHLVWPNEIKKWEQFNSLTIEVAHGKNREKAFQSKADIVVINPDGLSAMAAMVGSKKFTFRDKNWMLIVDESSNFKNPKTSRFKTLKRALGVFGRTVIATATPAPNGLLQLWSQVYLLDKGERLEKNFTAFRNRYFYQSDYMGYTYSPHDWTEKAIYEKIKDIVIHKSSNELDLPERLDNFIPVELDLKAQKLYKTMKKEMVIELEDSEITAVTAAVVVNKLKQISNGGIYNEEGESIVIHNEKTKAIEEIVESLGGKPLMVFYEYKHDLERLRKAFPQAKILGEEFEPTEKLVEDWNNDQVPVFLIQVQRGSHGLNLQGGSCTDVVWYSIPYDLELYIQACGRVHRQGVKNTVIIHHIVCQETIDEKIIGLLKNKTKLQDKLLESLLV